MFKVKPEYPAQARTGHISGDVVMDVTLKPDGTVIGWMLSMARHRLSMRPQRRSSSGDTDFPPNRNQTT